MDLQQWFSGRLSRRRAIRILSILAGAGLSIDAGILASSRVTAEKYTSNSNPINHILIACQENQEALIGRQSLTFWIRTTCHGSATTLVWGWEAQAG